MKTLLLRALLSVLGAGMLVLSAYLALVKGAEEVEFSLPIVGAVLIALIMSLLPKQQPVPLEERLGDLGDVVLNVVRWFSWFDAGVLSGLIVTLVIATTFLPKAFLVFFACLAGVGIFGLLIALTLGEKHDER